VFKFENHMSTGTVIEMLNHGLNWLRITGTANVVAEAAQIIGKTTRTVEAYRARSEDRQISADDLMKIFVEATARFAVIPRVPRVPITVFSSFGSPMVRVHSIFSASFLADMYGGHWQIEDGHHVVPRHLPERASRKSCLRTLLHTRAVTVEEACAALDCCPYALVAMQIEEPLVDVAAPSIEGLARLNMIATERMGEAA